MTKRAPEAPSNASPEQTSTGLRDVAESVSYFIAGGFLVWTVLDLKRTSAVVPGLAEWLTIALGAFLMLAGFVFLLMVPLRRCITPASTTLITRIRRHVGAIVFSVTLFTLVRVVFSSVDCRPMYVGGLIFLAAVMVMIVVMSWSSVLKQPTQLLKISVSLNTLAIIMLVAGFSLSELVAVVAISLLFTVIALRTILQPTKSL